MPGEHVRGLMDDAPLALVVLDTQARILHWNPIAEATFGWSGEEVLGAELPTVPDDEREEFLASQERVRAGESMRAVPARHPRKDGVMLDLQLSASALRDRRGRVTGSILMITDVTTHKKLEAQLRMAQKMEAVGLLAGGVAHDFNNLLTAIKGFTALLQLAIEDREDAAEFLGEIDKAADRAAALTSQLLAFSRRQLLRPEALDLNARVRDLERMLRLLLREEGKLILDLNPELDEVLADPGQIEQVILNLAVNARDAIRGRDGGTVTISTTNAELREEFTRWGVQDAPGSYVRLDVADNGVGMDRATQARIFDPFFTTKDPGQGTGLGLATVYGIVKQSGGYVWVDSRPNQGSVFSIYLPRAKNRSRTNGFIAGVGAGGTERVLLVDDDDSVRRVAQRALELHGYSVTATANGASALEIFDPKEFDLLITDVMMPGMLGPTIAVELRRQAPELPILFMSGHSAEIAREGLLDPATPFLGKPFTPAQLAMKVREVLDQAVRIKD